jgi:hypothetical protein
MSTINKYTKKTGEQQENTFNLSKFETIKPSTVSSLITLVIPSNFCF